MQLQVEARPARPRAPRRARVTGRVPSRAARIACSVASMTSATVTVRPSSARQRGDAGVGDAAGHDPVERGEVGIAVDGEARAG